MTTQEAKCMLAWMQWQIAQEERRSKEEAERQRMALAIESAGKRLSVLRGQRIDVLV